VEFYETNHDRGPFFAYLHLIDLHRPFDLAIALAHAVAGTELMEGLDEWDCRAYSGNADDVARFRGNKLKLYDGLIRYVDSQIERLVEYLERRRVFDDTIVVVTADHGEEFWDHEEFELSHYACGRKSSEPWLMGTGHGHTVFNELLHVPMIFINPPDVLSAAATSSPVSTVDILPTLLSFLRIDLRLQLDGESLTREFESREILAESTLYGFERKAIIKDNIKIISSPGDRHCALYDLSLDPGELNPIRGGIDPAILERLAGLHGSPEGTTGL
jgi:arylsulfatase A-like enzyme